MAKCSYCGMQAPAGARTCPSCGAALSSGQGSSQPSSGHLRPASSVSSNTGKTSKPPVVDTGSAGWAILGFIIPIVGIILGIVWFRSKPKSAMYSFVGAVVGILANVAAHFIFHLW